VWEGDDVHRVTELTDGVVTIRPTVDAHVDELHAAVVASIPELSPWLPWCHEGYERAEMAEFVRRSRRARERGQEYHFAVHDAATGAVIGACGLRIDPADAGLGEIGYWVATAATGRGIATRSVRLLAAWALGEVGLERIEIIVAVDNARSRAVARASGAHEEGVARRRITLGDQRRADAVMHSIVRGDLV
jgi:RimJ/RimL family protein N-acetyltransferase